MAGSSRDVELVIRARDEAGKAIAGIHEALTALTGAQNAAGESAGKASGLLGELGTTFADIKKQIDGLAGLATVAKQVDRAAEAISRLENAANQSGQGVAGLAAKQEQLAKAGADLTKRAEESTAAIKAQKAVVDASAAEQGKLAERITAAGAAYTRTVAAVRASKAPSEELLANYRAQRGALVALVEKQLQAETVQATERKRLVDLVTAHTQVAKEVSVNSTAQERLQRDVTTATEALGRQQAALEAARAQLAEISGAGQEAAQSMGGIALTQEAIATASKAAAEALAKVNEAMKAQRASAGGQVATPLGPAAQATAAYRAQVQAVRDAKAAWEQARVAATALGQEIAKTVAPTREQQTAMVLAKAEIDRTRQSYDQASGALVRLKEQARTAFEPFRGLQQVRRDAAAAVPALEALPPIAPQIRPLGASIMDLVRALMRVPDAAGKAGSSLRSMSEGSRESLGLFQRLRGEVMGLAAGYIGLYAAAHQIGEIIKATADVESAQARLSIVFDGNQKRAATEIQFLLSQAERLGIPFSELATQYTKVAVASKEMEISAESNRKIFLSLAEAGRISGLSAHEMQGVFLGLRESIDRGTLNARNFNLEIGAHIPGAMKAMADALGIGIGKFTELQRASGGIAASEDTLVRFSENLRKELGGALPQSLNTLNAQMGRLKTYTQEAEIQIGQGGFGDAIKRLVDDIGRLSKNDQGAQGFRDLGAALGGLTGLVDLAARNFDVLLKLFQLFIALKVANAVLNLTSANGALGKSFAAASKDVDRLIVAFSTLNVQKMQGAWAGFRVQVAATGASLAAMGPQGVIAAGGAAAANGALLALRGAMIGLTTVARAMWAAIGGFPGLIITGLTFVLGNLLGDWIGGVRSATTAMDEHSRILEKVQRGYAEAAGAAGDLKKAVQELSSVQIEANSAKLREELNSLRNDRAVRNGPGVLENDVFGSTSAKTLAELKRLTEAFKAGKLDAADFKAQVNALAEADPHLDRTLVTKLLDVADRARQAEAALKENNAALRVIRGTASDTDRALLGLATSIGAVNGALSTGALDRYNDALDKMRKLAPDTKKDEKFRQDQDSAKSDLTNSLQALKLSEDQIKAVLASSATIPGLTAQQEGKVKEAYALYQRVLTELKAREEKAQDDALPRDKANLRQRIQYVEGEGPNSRSTASGYGQFTQGTWLGQFDKVFPQLIDMTDAAKLALRSDKAVADKMLDELIRHNQGQLARAGIEPTDGNSYLAHFLGAAGAIKVLIANPKEIAASLNPAAANSNPNVFYRGYSKKNPDKSHPVTVGELEEWAALKMGGSIVGGRTHEAEILATGKTKQEEFNDQLAEFVKGLQDSTRALAENARATFIAAKVHEQEAKARSEGVNFSPAQRSAVANAAGQDFDARAADAAAKKVAELRLEYDKLTKGEDALTREQFIANEARRDSIDLMRRQGQEYATLRGKIFDLQQQQRAYDNVIGLNGQLKTAASRLKGAFEEGDGKEIARLKIEIGQIIAEINAGLPAARAYAAALGDQKMVANLAKVAKELNDVKTTLVEARDINKTLATGLTGAFDKSFASLGKFIQGGEKLKDLFGSIRDSFLQFAADFLKHIATMILQQQILNLLNKLGIGDAVSSFVNKAAGGGASVAAATGTITTSAAEAGAAAFAATAGIPVVGPALAPAAGAAAEAAVLATYLPQIAAAGLKHMGGLVGEAGGMSRPVSSAVFDAAVRMHSGGIAGLAADEVPTILQRNEEVLTQSDPRHRFNLGGSAPAAPASAPSVKIVNAFDHAEVLSHALNTTEGQRAVINFVRQNSRTMGQALRSGA